MFNSFIKKISASFDHDETTGPDYKKLTAFWFSMVATFLLVAYCVKKIELWWFGIRVLLRDDLSEFKWILGIVLGFILVLIYFSNSKSLAQFILKFNAKKDDLDKSDVA